MYIQETKKLKLFKFLNALKLITERKHINLLVDLFVSQ